MQTVLGLVVDFALGFLWWIVLFPIVWLLSTPIILATALFRRKAYRGAVAEMYGIVTTYWREWGALFVP